MTCLFFEKLPGELRNNVYELVFALDNTHPVDILNAQPPRKDFLLTCRQANAEGGGNYQAAYRQSWAGTDFVLQIPSYGDDTTQHINAVQNLRHDDMIHITSLACKPREPSSQWYTIELVDTRGGWLHTCQHSASNESSHR
ncbi:hypothetical protein CLAFUW4_13939 [Fulvia fulva]|uniref:uncharacterized protein n=1 Tax=Passalora fulva TaxID=5499 RepID=UPI0028529972|nr:uncharacterized protein CLAFUR5_20364 [Fulvia fulva]KAK4610226.1 hypothetical protein CLAFUR4_13942 [Fulvia fulva]KAK4611056.1 hypothetical protein CLAFUR0_13946 [Fulvia fulva]WMI39074.1 hypothetical protein CLAFUR5_20364 [Fulvia fulva]WPV22333.1 hypothetical protein CLAFUW4_13939 [Fulvia fulva]WPV36704.1 hypothetical protein CLAFUW7_13947 [Fulvia fulva]